MINISISYRAIKISAIFIAVVIFAATAIPAGSQQTLREGITLELPGVNEERFESPFLESPLDGEIRMYANFVRAIGLKRVGEVKHIWARVNLTERSRDELGLSRHSQTLYIPNPRLQSLFEMAKTTGVMMQIECHEIVEPEGFELIGSPTLYEVTEVVVYTSQLPPGT